MSDDATTDLREALEEIASKTSDPNAMHRARRALGEPQPPGPPQVPWVPGITAPRAYNGSEANTAAHQAEALRLLDEWRRSEALAAIEIRPDIDEMIERAIEGGRVLTQYARASVARHRSEVENSKIDGYDITPSVDAIADVIGELQVIIKALRSESHPERTSTASNYRGNFFVVFDRAPRLVYGETEAKRWADLKFEVWKVQRLDRWQPTEQDDRW